MNTIEKSRFGRSWSVAVVLGLALLAIFGLTRTGFAAPLASALPAPSAPEGKSTLGDYVWIDYNQDGQHSGAEAEYMAGINNVLVNLYLDLNKNGQIDPGEYVSNMLTGNNPNTPGVETGWYDFAVNANGNWFIVELDPSNFQPGGPLVGYTFTSDATYGPSPMVVPMLDPIMDYNDADFGFYITQTAVSLASFAAVSGANLSLIGLVAAGITAGLLGRGARRRRATSQQP